MDDAGAMRSVECGRDLYRVVERFVERQRSLREPVGERFAVQKLHDQVGHQPLACRAAVAPMS